jgi:RNA polymerase sigma-70 factor, ECF subfamily
MTDDRERVFRRERAHLLAVAFRLLGSEADAQDAVQEAWLRYARADAAVIDDPAAWLVTVVTRLCLDVLRSARERPQETVERPAETAGPEAVALLADDVTGALVVVLDELTPPQRVAFVLHDVFGTPFDEVAHVLTTTPGSAKKLASRARARVRRPAGRGGADAATARRVVRAFLDAAQRGDVDGLVRVLHPDVTRTADPQVLRGGAAQRMRGAHPVATETRELRAVARRAELVTVGGWPAIAVRSGAGTPIVLVFLVDGERIAHVDVVADPCRRALLEVSS